MKNTFHALFLFTSFQLVLCKAAQAQERPLNLAFNDIRFTELLDTLEKRTGSKFYYNPAHLDTGKIQFNYTGNSLQNALEQLFKNTNLGFAIDQQNRVFISKGLTLTTALPEDFYSNEPRKKKDPLVYTHAPVSAEKTTEAYTVGEPNNSNADRYTIAGYIRDMKTGEPIIGAALHVENARVNTVSDQSGYFSIMVPKGTNTLNVQSMGMEDAKMELLVQGNGLLNINMQTRVATLKNVVISAQKSTTLRSTQLGVQKIDIKTIKQVPVVFGEADVLRVLLTTPGVKTVGEASTGLNVRGGAADQNLILFNDANIYNPSHFFGMFSAFNPEVVKDVELFKGSIPARYGGRLSSVVNINGREGNKKEFSGSAGIGLLTSRALIEGPVVKDKASFILAGRTTYAEWLLKKLPSEYSNSRASFYDLNAIYHHDLNKNNTIHLSTYMSQDRFNLNSDTFYHYKNQNISLKWKHVFSSRFHSLFTTGHDKYSYNIYSDQNPVNAYDLSFSIAQTYFKAHFNYLLNNKHTIEFGLNTTRHSLHSGNYRPLGTQSLVTPVVMPTEQALESALYVSDQFKISPDLSVEAGLRYSIYNYLGPFTVNNYAPDAPKREDNILGTTTYGKGKFIQTYQGPEIRIGVRQSLSPTLSLKAGYNSLRQYIHMLSNTAAMAPTDIWKLSDPNIKPQFGDQVSIGLYKNLKNNTIEVSLEGYYKKIKNYLDFKSGAELVLNPHIETDVMGTRGKAYGAELLIKKTTGKFNGWISYTYSRILLKADDASTGESINNGAYYPANYDKPHDATFIGNYRISHRFSVSFNATYSTGRPITLPIGKFFYADGMRTLYGDRNSHRIPDYFRTDLSFNIEGNHKVKQKTRNSWTIGAYNLTGQKNPYSVYYVSKNGVINGYKLSIFGSIIPFVNFNIKF
ncbi:MAG: TonB-dependent receptor [Chitinophagaceae bacterium]